MRLKIFVLAALTVALAVAAGWADQGPAFALDAGNPGPSFARAALIIAGILCAIIVVVIVVVIVILLTKKKPPAPTEPSEPAGPSEPEPPSEPKEPSGGS